MTTNAPATRPRIWIYMRTYYTTDTLIRLRKTNAPKSDIIHIVHNANYASGFLYHPSTEKILLQLTPENRDASLWSLFSDRQTVEDQADFFQKIIFDQLRILLQLTAIVPIYDYMRPARRETHFIYYAEVEHDDMKLRPKRGCTVRWFTQKEIMKLSLPPQVRHDIMIGTRVIRSIVDKRMATQAGTSLNKS